MYQSVYNKQINWSEDACYLKVSKTVEAAVFSHTGSEIFIKFTQSPKQHINMYEMSICSQMKDLFYFNNVNKLEK